MALSYYGKTLEEKPSRMRVEYKQPWLDALRGGQYKQGIGYLHMIEVLPDRCIDYPFCESCETSNDVVQNVIEGTDKYCCLGVICDTNGIEWSEITENESDGMDTFGIYSPDVVDQRVADICVIGPSLGQQYGLSENVINYLTYMNDDARYSFEEIADWIEENL